MSSAPRWVGPVAAGVGVALAMFSWWLERPPGPRGETAPASAFSAARARDHLREIAVRPHMIGSAEHERVREYLVDELIALGFEVEVQRATVIDPRGRILRAATVRNILARKPGTDSTGGVALASHYDSQQLTPAAGDAGSGVAAILEALRALGTEESLRNDLYVLITDGEELGLLGARAVVAEHRWWPRIDVVLNFEARGNAGQSVMFETNEGNAWVVREFARADPHPTGSSLYYEIYQRIPNDTDFSVFKRAGAAGLNFALAEGADVYHRSTDSIGNLSMASLQHHGEHALSMARHFGGSDLTAASGGTDAAYFRFPGVGLVSYPIGWVGWLSLLVVVFAAVVVDRGFRRGALSIGGMVTGLAIGLLAPAASAGLGVLLWSLVQDAHHELGSLQGRALYQEGWYALALGALAVAAVAVGFSAARARFSAASLAAGGLLVPLALALVAWWYAPGVNMLLLWPSLLAVGGLRYLMTRRARDRFGTPADLAVIVVLSAPVVLMLFPLVWTVHMGLNISVAPITAACAALMLLLLLPLFELAGAPNRGWLPATALGLAVAFAGIGVLDARPGPARPVPSDLVYVLDRDGGRAAWATMQPGDDGWIERFVGGDAEHGDLADFLAGNPRPYRLAPAPTVSAAEPRVEIVGNVLEAGRRRVRIEIESALGPELINVSRAGGVPVTITAVNGVPVPPRLDAGAGRQWLLQHFGRPPAGVLTIELVAESAEARIELVLVEFLMRLPPVPGVDTERPPGWTAHARRLTDASLFRQTITIE